MSKCYWPWCQKSVLLSIPTEFNFSVPVFWCIQKGYCFTQVSHFPISDDTVVHAVILKPAAGLVVQSKDVLPGTKERSVLYNIKDNKYLFNFCCTIVCSTSSITRLSLQLGPRLVVPVHGCFNCEKVRL